MLQEVVVGARGDSCARAFRFVDLSIHLRLSGDCHTFGAFFCDGLAAHAKPNGVISINQPHPNLSFSTRPYAPLGPGPIRFRFEWSGTSRRQPPVFIYLSNTCSWSNT